MDNNNEQLIALRQRLVELDARKPEISAYYDELNSVKRQIAELQGFDTYFQAPSGEVFKIFKPTNKIVFFDDAEYKRTAREGEPSQGRLSKKEAREQGFEVE